jgi:esterase
LNTFSIIQSEKTELGNQSLIFLHGLLGSSRNWRSVTKGLNSDFNIHAIDLRNHGNSFHHDDCSVLDMCNDLVRYFDHHNLKQAILCGHSLGGKVAMRFACDYPDRVQKLIVADIAPRDYPSNHHIPTLDALLSLDLSQITSRKQADDCLADVIPNWAFRQFLLTNLIQSESSFSWKANIRVLRDTIVELSSNPLTVSDCFRGETLFISGGKSGYLRSEHKPEILKYFPAAEFVVLPNAGHDVHVEDRSGFLSALDKFLSYS